MNVTDRLALEAFSHAYAQSATEGARLVLCSDWDQVFEFEPHTQADAVTLFGAIEQPAIPDCLRELLVAEAKRTRELDPAIRFALIFGVGLGLLVGWLTAR